MGRKAVVEAGRIRRQNVALLVCQELLDRIRLLDVCDVPVADPLPGRVGVAAEDQLTRRSVHLQELRPVGMATERGVDYEASGDPEASVSISATVCGGYPQTGLRAQACCGGPIWVLVSGSTVFTARMCPSLNAMG